MAKVAERITWAVEVIAPEPGDRILEVGCGTGVAVSLIAPLLTTGVITAIDRSAKAIATAIERNRAHVEAGNARFLTMSLHEAENELGPFDMIFAINVNDFWLKPGRELPAVRSLLRPEGRLLVFLQPPSEARVREFTRLMPAHLEEHGFDITNVLVQPMHPVSIACVIGRVAGQADAPV